MDRSTNTGRVIKRMDVVASNFLNTSTIIYGATGSGKSIMGINILNEIGNSVSMIYVVSPCENMNKVFKGYVPSIAIRTDAHPSKIMVLMKSIWDRQQTAVSIYREAMNMKTLTILYARIRNTATDTQLKSLVEFFKQAFKKLERFLDTDKGSYETENTRLLEIQEKLLTDFFRQSIAPYRSSLLEDASLLESERKTLRYLYFNPNICLVLDDCVAQLMKIQRTSLFTDYLYKGRHAKISLIIMAQDDTDVDSNLRKNVYQSIFCTAQVSQSFFSRASNAFNKKEKKDVEDINQSIFTGRADDFAKLIWQRMSPNPFQFIIARKITERTPLGSDAFWSYCSKVGLQTVLPDRNNEFYNEFY